MNKREVTRRDFLRLSAVAAAGAVSAACVPAVPAPPATPAKAPPTPTPVPKEPVTVEGITFHHWGGYTGKERLEFIEKFTKEKGRPPKDEEIPAFDRAEFWNKVSAKLKEQSPEITVTWEIQSYRDGRPKVEVRVAAGDPPDIVVWSKVDTMRFALLGVLADLKEAIDPYRADYNPTFLRTFQGKNYDVPMKGFIHGWRLNPILFEKNGVAHLLPTEETGWMWSHDAFLEATKAVTKGTGATATYGFAGWGDWPFFYPLTFSFGGRAWGEDGKTFVMADDPKAIQGAQFMVDMIKKHKITPPENVSEAVGGMTDSLFAEGRLGMTEVGTYGQDAWYKEQQELGKLDPTKVKLDTVVAPSDVKNGIKPQHYLGADGACVFKRKEADRTGGAIAFLTFIQKSPEYARIYRAGGWPIRKAMEEADDKLPYRVAYIQKMSEFGSEQLMMPYWVAVRPITNPMWEAIIAGTKPIPELLKEAQAKIAEYIEKDQKRLIG